MSADSPVAKTDAVGLSDAEFLRQFADCTLPYVHWTHRAHLRVAYLYVTQFGLADAIPKVTAGIRAYNRSQNIVDTPTSGYHETMTVAWLHIVAAMVAEYGPTGETDRCRASASLAAAGGAPALQSSPAEQFLAAQTHLQEKKLLRLFYSRERFGSPEAKYTFVPPDLAPLPSARHV
ncbi:MAG: hypothetical protein ABJF10_18280 [Chthoniobacter sp.]|uniref:hypothetical protein n=1 Tax=Chthoniobacter sp. TaxID=2510640 RepID=UPI0032AB7470